MTPAPTPPSAPPAINYLKLTASLTVSLSISLLAAVLFWHLINDWPTAKDDFLEGYREGQKMFAP